MSRNDNCVAFCLKTCCTNYAEKQKRPHSAELKIWSSCRFRPPKRLSDNRAMSYDALSHGKQGVTGNKEEWMKYICLGYIEPRKIGRDGRGRATRNVRRMICAHRPSAGQRTPCC